jgi:transposase
MPQRTPLRPISSNIIPNKELSPYQRAIIIGRAQAGQKPSQIGKELNIPRDTVKYTLQKDPIRNEAQSIPRSGRPRKLSLRDERAILRILRKNPKITWRELLKESNLNVSKSTYYRMLKRHNIKKWLAAKRPKLTDIHAEKRLQWALEHRDWSIDQWKAIIWSDECTVERGAGKRQEWVFRTRLQRYDRDKIQAYHKGKDISIMVWAAFWGSGRSEILRVPFDPESQRGGASSHSYLGMLKEIIPTIWEPGLIFMQDNASIHTAKIVRDWLDELGIPVMEWPAYSPDLNPIEHCWAWIKDWIHKTHPELEILPKRDNSANNALFEAIVEAWEAMRDEILDNLINSMSRRCAAVIEAEGWYTKY